jgi:hypothetical protein
MATTTPNFGWPVPTSTDLVKDGATAIEALGDGVDASLVDLKGGTTGQVLAKTSATDLDFTWVTTDDANAIQNSIVDAKGDLISATGNDTPARLAVGSNGETLVANSAASSGLQYNANFAAGKNKLINGAFDVWQRGTSFSNPSGTYTADRFLVAISGGSGGTASQQTFTPGTAPVAGYEGQYYLRLASNAGATYLELAQRVEDVRAFAGQTITLSFWAKATTSVTFTPLLRQNFGSGGSANVDTSGSAQAIASASWTRYSLSVTLPSVSGKTIGTSSYLGVILYSSAGTTASNTVEFWGVQLEAGSVATAFQTATGTLQGELAACSRYYQVCGAASGFGAASSATNAAIYFPFNVSMRIAPTSITFSTLTNALISPGIAIITPSTLTFNTSSTKGGGIDATITGSALARPIFWYDQTVAFNAEL